ncbi:MAG: hypothetical protein ABFD98_03995 [Syntrophobacteraceae bacterium]|nr:hypothetical protein [Desulfobacteraceae bacterium]
MIRILFFGLLIFLVYMLLKSSGLLPWGGRDEEEEDSSASDADLVQDPQCKSYFLKQRGVKAQVGGRTIYFCSEACRDKYLKG